MGAFKYDGKAYGIVIQNVLMLYRTDEFGTNGEELHFDHWADVVNSGYTWYRQNKVGGTTNANINSAMLYPFVDPASPAGGISVDGWKTLWKFCADGKFGGDEWKYGIEPLNRGDVQVTEFYSSSLYGSIDTAADSSEHPLKGTLNPENWALADIKDGPTTSPSIWASSTALTVPRKRPRPSRPLPSGSALPLCRPSGAKSSTPSPATPLLPLSSIPTASPPFTRSPTSP